MFCKPSTQLQNQTPNPVDLGSLAKASTEVDGMHLPRLGLEVDGMHLPRLGRRLLERPQVEVIMLLHLLNIRQ